ncbi:MAG: chemotaxis protein CheW [bacterium]
MHEQPRAITEVASARAVADEAQVATNLLLARARQLAREQPCPDRDNGNSIEVLEFGLAGERYAFELVHLREVSALSELTPLPGVPDFILGVTCVHGQIIAVIDLRKLFGLPERGLRDAWQVLVLQSEAMEFGILAERIAGVRQLALDELQSSLSTLTGVRAAYLKGIAPDGTVLLSADKLLTDPQLVVQQPA